MVNMYRRKSKNWGTENNYNGRVCFYSAAMRPKDVDRMTNRVEPDQIAQE